MEQHRRGHGEHAGETTQFSLPAGLPLGTYSLTVVANGIASAPVSFTGGFTGADLAVTNSGPSTSTEGNNVTYSLTVTNIGPSTATNVVLTDTLDANLKYVSATKSQGSFTHSGSTVTFSFGTVAVGQTVTATVTAQALEDGNLTNAASVTSSLSDANPNNNSASVTTSVAEPAIVVSAPIQVSGKNQSNVKVATFTHANGVEPASDFVATINWGDNTTSPGTITLSGTTYTVKGSHTYSGGGSHTVTTTVVEAGSWPNFAMASVLRPAVAVAVPAPRRPSTSVRFGEHRWLDGDATPSASKGARDAILASTTGLGASIAPWSSKVNLAGAQPVADTDSLDALFERLNDLEPDALHFGKSSGQLG